MLAAAPRFFTRLLKKPGDLPLGEGVWHDTVVAVSGDGLGVGYRDVFTGEVLHTADYGGITGLRCADLWCYFPVALLEKII